MTARPRRWVPTTRKRNTRARAARARVDRHISGLYAEFDDLHWHSTRPGAFLSLMAGQRTNGSRLTYETELDPGPIDAGQWCPYDPGGAQAYDDGTW